MPFLTRVLRRCSREFHPLLLSVPSLFLGGQNVYCSVQQPWAQWYTFSVYWLQRHSLQSWGCRGTFKGLMYTSHPQHCFEHLITRLCLVRSFIVRAFLFVWCAVHLIGSTRSRKYPSRMSILLAGCFHGG